MTPLSALSTAPLYRRQLERLHSQFPTLEFSSFLEMGIQAWQTPEANSTYAVYTVPKNATQFVIENVTDSLTDKVGKVHRECPSAECPVNFQCPILSESQGGEGHCCGDGKHCCPPGSSCLNTNPPVCVSDDQHDIFRCELERCKKGFKCPYEGVTMCCAGGDTCCPMGYECTSEQPTRCQLLTDPKKIAEQKAAAEALLAKNHAAEQQMKEREKKLEEQKKQVARQKEEREKKAEKREAKLKSDAQQEQTLKKQEKKASPPQARSEVKNAKKKWNEEGITYLFNEGNKSRIAYPYDRDVKKLLTLTHGAKFVGGALYFPMTNPGCAKASREHTDLFQFGSNPFSFSFRIMTKSDSQMAHVIAKRGTRDTHYYAVAVDRGKIVFSLGPQSAIVSKDWINDNQWHSVIVVRDVAAKELRIYIDGVISTAGYDSSTHTLDNPAALEIGCWHGSNGVAVPFNGLIRDVHLISRVLTDDEVIDAASSQSSTEMDQRLRLEQLARLAEDELLFKREKAARSKQAAEEADKLNAKKLKEQHTSESAIKAMEAEQKEQKRLAHLRKQQRIMELQMAAANAQSEENVKKYEQFQAMIKALAEQSEKRDAYIKEQTAKVQENEAKLKLRQEQQEKAEQAAREKLAEEKQKAHKEQQTKIDENREKQQAEQAAKRAASTSEEKRKAEEQGEKQQEQRDKANKEASNKAQARLEAAHKAEEKQKHQIAEERRKQQKLEEKEKLENKRENAQKKAQQLEAQELTKKRDQAGEAEKKREQKKKKLDEEIGKSEQKTKQDEKISNARIEQARKAEAAKMEQKTKLEAQREKDTKANEKKIEEEKAKVKEAKSKEEKTKQQIEQSTKAFEKEQESSTKRNQQEEQKRKDEAKKEAAAKEQTRKNEAKELASKDANAREAKKKQIEKEEKQKAEDLKRKQKEETDKAILRTEQSQKKQEQVTKDQQAAEQKSKEQTLKAEQAKKKIEEETAKKIAQQKKIEQLAEQRQKDAKEAALREAKNKDLERRAREEAKVKNAAKQEQDKKKADEFRTKNEELEKAKARGRCRKAIRSPSPHAGHYRKPTYGYPGGWNFIHGWSFESRATVVGDFNGDGRQDYVRLGGTYCHFFISDPNSDGKFYYPVFRYPAGWNFGHDENGWTTLPPIDLDGDKRTDIVRTSSTYQHGMLMRGGNNDCWYRNGDIPSHCVTLTTFHYPFGWNFRGPWTFNYDRQPVVGDFNGDGRQDFARLGPTYIHFFISKGNGQYFSPIYPFPGGWNFGWDENVWTTLSGFFQKDCSTAIIRTSGHYHHGFYNQGTNENCWYRDGWVNGNCMKITTYSYPHGWNFVGGWSWNSHATIVGDFNGDGLDDFVRAGGTYFHFFINKGDGTFYYPIVHAPPNFNFLHDENVWSTLPAGDYDGDGRTDILRASGTYMWSFFPRGANHNCWHVNGWVPHSCLHHVSESWGHLGWNFIHGWSWNRNYAVKRIDINGDGKDDFINLNGGTYNHMFISM